MDKTTIDQIVDKLRELVSRGNVSRVIIRARNGNELLNLPVNAGIVGGVILFGAAKWALIIGALTTVGLGCTVEVIKVDGEIINVVKPEDSEKVQAFASVVAEEVKSSVSNIVSKVAERKNGAVDADYESVDENDSKDQ